MIFLGIVTKYDIGKFVAAFKISLLNVPMIFPNVMQVPYCHSWEMKVKRSKNIEQLKECYAIKCDAKFIEDSFDLLLLHIH